ncbi:site-specific integrase [Sulfitobacter sp. S190]|uniref:site-specific integrase n=1 Tax=Sulfitobacter sp. S190 TaxID=2867022 RepID=UPI0021A49644|nr:site-specific integrase [Sulfitobacter sp. S190]
MVRSYFAKALDGYVSRLNDTGWPDQQLNLLKQELDVHEDAIGGFDDLSDLYLDAGNIEGFRASAGLSDDDWAENESDLRRELRKARRDQIKAFLCRAESLEGFSFTEPAQTAPAPPQARSASLGDAYADFMAEHQHWSDQMAKKARGFLAVLLEYFGQDRLMADITRNDASELKKVVQALPVNRNTKPETRHLPLMEAIEITGVQKVSVETVNNHLAMFFRFWDWAERHGHAPHKLFEGMKVAKAKRAKSGRKAYTKAQTAKLYAELTENHAGLVKKDDHKWGSLLGLYTGARLNEIAQLEHGDIGQEDGIWFINITDDGDNKKRVKANASRRKVPIHSELIRLGFLDWVATKANEPRLFMTFSYDQKDGYGRNLGRWFNTRFLTGLGSKEDGLVFHSLRHTAVTRMRQAGVELALVQEIVGHERGSVTDGYFGEGYTLAQKRDAIKKFKV